MDASSNETETTTTNEQKKMMEPEWTELMANDATWCYLLIPVRRIKIVEKLQKASASA